MVQTCSSTYVLVLCCCMIQTRASTSAYVQAYAVMSRRDGTTSFSKFDCTTKKLVPTGGFGKSCRRVCVHINGSTRMRLVSCQLSFEIRSGRGCHLSASYDIDCLWPSSRAQELLGSRQGLLDHTPSKEEHGNGHIARNIRLALMAVDLVEPYVQWGPFDAETVRIGFVLWV